MKFIAGRSNKKLAEKLGNLSKVEIKNFADNEIYVRIDDELNAQDVVIIQSTISNEYLVELLLLINAAKMQNPKKITALIPYFGYSRQDRVVKKGEALSSRLVANLLKAAGADAVLTLDIHSPRIKEYFEIEFVDLDPISTFAQIKADIVVAPDKGAENNAKELAELIGCSYCSMDKTRLEHNKVAQMQLCHDVEGKDCILFDDMIDTGGTIVRAAELLKSKGAASVSICATHGIFSANVLEKLENMAVSAVYITDTIENKEIGKIKILSVAPKILSYLQGDFIER